MTYHKESAPLPQRPFGLMTGLRPDTTQVYDLHTHFRLNMPDAITLPQHFKDHGYHAQGFSKIYHGGLGDPLSWSVPHETPAANTYADPGILESLQKRREEIKSQGRRTRPQVVERDPKTGAVLKRIGRYARVRGPAWESADVPDNFFRDGKTAELAVKTLNEVKDQPFFLATGFVRPHLPFVAPKISPTVKSCIT